MPFDWDAFEDLTSLRQHLTLHKGSVLANSHLSGMRK